MSVLKIFDYIRMHRFRGLDKGEYLKLILRCFCKIIFVDNF